MLQEAYSANEDFAPRAFLLDKAACEHKAVEAVLLQRAQSGLQKIIEMLSNELASLAGEVTSTQLAMALDHFKQRQAREEHLDKLATGVTGYVC